MPAPRRHQGHGIAVLGVPQLQPRRRPGEHGVQARELLRGWLPVPGQPLGEVAQEGAQRGELRDGAPVGRAVPSQPPPGPELGLPPLVEEPVLAIAVAVVPLAVDQVDEEQVHDTTVLQLTGYRYRASGRKPATVGSLVTEVRGGRTWSAVARARLPQAVGRGDRLAARDPGQLARSEERR